MKIIIIWIPKILTRLEQIIILGWEQMGRVRTHDDKEPGALHNSARLEPYSPDLRFGTGKYHFVASRCASYLQHYRQHIPTQQYWLLEWAYVSFRAVRLLGTSETPCSVLDHERLWIFGNSRTIYRLHTFDPVGA